MAAGFLEGKFFLGEGFAVGKDGLLDGGGVGIHGEGLRTDAAVAAYARKGVFEEGIRCEME